MASDPAAKEKFQKVSDAWAVLGDDRQRCAAYPVNERLKETPLTPLPSCRRAYDKSLAESAGPHRHSAAGTPFRTQYADASWAFETRRRPGATHAWEARRHGAAGYRHPGRAPPPGQGPFSEASAQGSASAGRHYDPTSSFSSPNVQKATGFAKGSPMTDADHAHRVSTVWRAIQVIGLVMIVATLGGGFRASV